MGPESAARRRRLRYRNRPGRQVGDQLSSRCSLRRDAEPHSTGSRASVPPQSGGPEFFHAGFAPDFFALGAVLQDGEDEDAAGPEVE